MKNFSVHNRPTIGTLLTAFVMALIQWVYTYVPVSIPEEVRTSGVALVIAFAAYGIGKAVQHVGDRAPWADDTHRMAVAYAMSVNPSDWGPEQEELLKRLGLTDLADVRDQLGLDQP